MSRASASAPRPVAGLVYGVHVQGRLPAEFEPYLRQTDSGREASLEVRCQAVDALAEIDPIWVAEASATTSGGLALFREPDGFGLAVTHAGQGLFRITDEAISIQWLPGGAGPAFYFFSYALPLWLEARGIPVLHASAVALGHRVIAFVGRSGTGKSTLCAQLVRSGHSFVADDGLPLYEDERGDWRCAHGPPLLRLWPSALQQRLGTSAKELERVQDSVEKRSMPCAWTQVADPRAESTLATVYVLEPAREDQADVVIEDCSARESLILLVEHSLAGAPLTALGLAAQRLERLSRVATRTPVKRLRYPVAGDRWPLIRQAIEEDRQASQ